MSDEITTARLRLRRWRPEDEQPMAAINHDPAVTEFLNRPVDEQAVAAFFGLVTEHWEQHGFSFYALELRNGVQTGKFVGFVGVAYPSFLPEVASRPELGWRLGRAVWGQGVATEAACAVRDDALGRLGLVELISVIHPRNARSQRVATKLGMTIERQVHNPVLALDVDIWQLDRADMAAGSARSSPPTTSLTSTRSSSISWRSLDATSRSPRRSNGSSRARTSYKLLAKPDTHSLAA